jgi:hypothetical protein
MANTSVMNIETHAEFGVTKNFKYGLTWQAACQFLKHAETRIFTGAQPRADSLTTGSGLHFAMRLAGCNAK